jgi:hypothetical protein
MQVRTGSQMNCLLVNDCLPNEHIFFGQKNGPDRLRGGVILRDNFAAAGPRGAKLKQLRHFHYGLPQFIGISVHWDS